MRPLNSATVLLLLNALLLPSASALKVCVIIEQAQTMLRPGVASVADVTSDDQLRGFDVDVRKKVLEGTSYSIKVDDSYGSLNVRTRSGEGDVGWGAFFQLASRESCNPSDKCLPLGAEATAALAGTGTIGSWEPYRCCVDFAPAHWTADVAILSIKGGSQNFFAFTFALLTEAFVINFFSFLFIWCIIVAALVWICERKQNSEEFPARFLDGIDDSLWWTIVTVTTVGYGDKTPKTPAGRILGVVWMLVGLTLFSILTGHMGGEFVKLTQTAGINSKYDLAGLRVCGYALTATAWYIPDTIEFTPVSASNVEECGKMLKDGLVDVIVMETAFMSYWSMNDPWASLQPLHISPPIASIPVGIMFPETANGMATRHSLAPKLLELFDGPFLLDETSKWFKAPDSTAAVNKLQWGLIVPALGMVTLYALLMTLRAWCPNVFAKAEGVMEMVEQSSLQRMNSVASMTSTLAKEIEITLDAAPSRSAAKANAPSASAP